MLQPRHKHTCLLELNSGSAKGKGDVDAGLWCSMADIADMVLITACRNTSAACGLVRNGWLLTIVKEHLVGLLIRVAECCLVADGMLLS